MNTRFSSRRTAWSAAALFLSLASAAAQASVVVTFTQIGNQVKGVWDGSLDTSAFPLPVTRLNTLVTTGISSSGLNFGPFAADMSEYVFPSFFTPFSSLFRTGTFDGGDAVVLQVASATETRLQLPLNYQSGAALHSEGSWNNRNFSSMGFNTTNVVMNLPGNQTISLRFVDANAVPEPASAALVGLALAGLGLSRRSAKARAAA